MGFIEWPTEGTLVVLQKTPLIFIFRSIVWRKVILLMISVSKEFKVGVVVGTSRGSRCQVEDRASGGLPQNHRLQVSLCKPFRLKGVEPPRVPFLEFRWVWS